MDGTFDGLSTLSRSNSVYEETLPSLPGFRSGRHITTTKRNQTIKYIDKQMFLTEARNSTSCRQIDLIASNSATSLYLKGGNSNRAKNLLLATNTVSRPQTSASYFTTKDLNATPEMRVLKQDMVLCFLAYFQEAVHDSSVETKRIRKCEIYYYVVDDSIQIVEPKMENSGVPQGNFMKRHRVLKEMSEDYVTLNEFEVGSSITIYGRTRVSCVYVLPDKSRQRKLCILPVGFTCMGATRRLDDS